MSVPESKMVYSIALDSQDVGTRLVVVVLVSSIIVIRRRQRRARRRARSR